MKYLQIKANKSIKLILEWELSKNIFRYIIANTILPYWVRQFAASSILNLPLKSSLVYLKNRCFFSNQPRSVSSFFKLNRMRKKIMASRGDLTGLRRNSW